MSWGVWLWWEANPLAPETYRAGEEWLRSHASYEPVLLDCPVDAARRASRFLSDGAGDRTYYAAPKVYSPTTPGEVFACSGPDLSGLGGFLP